MGRERKIAACALLLTLFCSSKSRAEDQALSSMSLEELMNVNVQTVSMHSQPIGSAPGAVSIVTAEDIRKYGLDSVYRYMIARGRGASRKDVTWNGNEHTCCHCRYPWRHFATCRHARPNWPDDLSDLKN